MQSLSQPVKFWYYGPMFRHDRPQAGRYRQFTQFGAESFGVREPVVDAELIAMAYLFMDDLGLHINIHINSLGTPEDRQNYLVELTGYLRTKRSYLCEDCKRRLTKNPLRVLDCKNEDCKAIIAEAPQIIEWLSEASKNYFMKVLEYLDELRIPYVLQSTLVRGLDYYTDTVFEIYQEDDEGTQSALGGGGRYDLLVEQLGGRPTPGAGFSIGLERVITAIRKQAEEGKSKLKEEPPIIFFAQLGDQARRRALLLLEDLRVGGILVGHSFGKSSLKGQMEVADKMHVQYSLILGQKEVQDGTVIIRDMESGIQEIVDQKKLKQNLQRKIEKSLT
jgi:histidyl-tRNA synthetase